MPEYLSQTIAYIQNELRKVIVGQDEPIEQILVALLAEGHALIEGVPGTAKTLTVKTLARIVNAGFGRIQFTPDLMPSDITGTNVFNMGSSSFSLRRGPIFTDILLADEINRTPPKTQAALLEAMEERQVTIDGESHPLHRLFFVVATQNPIELEGTYPLPEAQLDRFMMRVRVGYPDRDSERALVTAFHHRGGNLPVVSRALTSAQLESICQDAAQIRCDASIVDYVVELVRDTRQNPRVRLGGSPRSAQYLLAAAKARAALNGVGFVTPDDVKDVAFGVLN